MENKFKDSFNYLVAFLAVLVGLGAFKDIAEKNSVPLFGFSFNYFQLSTPFIALMLLAVYLGGLAILSRNITFKAFPLTKYLESLSYFFAAMGLLYPLLVLITAGISAVTGIIPKNVDIKQYVIVISLLIQAAAVIQLAIRYTSSRQQDKYDITLRELRTLVQTEKTPIDTTATAPYELVMLYHQFISISKALLKLQGYGITGENIRLIGDLLVAQKILHKKDLKQINKVRSMRNKIVHPDKMADKKELADTRKALEVLVQKVKDAIITLEKN